MLDASSTVLILNRPGRTLNSPTLPAVWKAAAYGDFDKLRELAQADPEALHRPDDQGFFALQWAALNNRVAVLTYLLDQGCDVSAADGTGQTALHWSAVRGSTAAMETLLRAGADLGARDSRCGCLGRGGMGNEPTSCGSVSHPALGAPCGCWASAYCTGQHCSRCRFTLLNLREYIEAQAAHPADLSAWPSNPPIHTRSPVHQGLHRVPRGGAIRPDRRPAPPGAQVERRHGRAGQRWPLAAALGRLQGLCRCPAAARWRCGKGRPAGAGLRQGRPPVAGRFCICLVHSGRQG